MVFVSILVLTTKINILKHLEIPRKFQTLPTNRETVAFVVNCFPESGRDKSESLSVVSSLAASLLHRTLFECGCPEFDRAYFSGCTRSTYLLFCSQFPWSNIGGDINHGRLTQGFRFFSHFKFLECYVNSFPPVNVWIVSVHQRKQSCVCTRNSYPNTKSNKFSSRFSRELNTNTNLWFFRLRSWYQFCLLNLIDWKRESFAWPRSSIPL